MSASEWAAHAVQVFDDVVAATPSLRPRAGQHAMAEQVAKTLAAAPLGKEEAAPVPAIAVIQAGTGVGKSLAYSAPAIALALQRGVRVIISTATVALQEQLVHKDLPALAAQIPQPFRFVLAKGRGRFVCQLKLERLLSTTPEEAGLFDDAPAAAAPPTASAQQQAYASLSQALASSQWDGDRDSLATPPSTEVWGPIAAEGSSCTGKHCPLFQNCSYFARRKELAGAQVIVANHDLLLSSLSGRVLPELDSSLLILDEAHHLPATALAQFACTMDLSRLQWLERLSSRALRIGQLLEVEEIADIPEHISGLRRHMTQLAQDVQAHYSDALQPSRGGPARVRLPQGMVPPVLQTSLTAMEAHSSGMLAVLRAIAKALRSAIKETPEQAPQLANLYAQLGSLAPRLEAVYDTTTLLLHQAEGKAAPAAKWFTLEMDDQWVALHAHASPILPGNTLRQHLWPLVRGAVLTSATMTSAGSFDFYLRETGLQGLGQVDTLEVASPFNYPQQGVLWAHHTQADPKYPDVFTPEMVRTLLQDLSQVRTGALVLFTSREQMRQAVDALPQVLRASVLVQNTMARTTLLATHRERVQAQQPSIIFGMQSFGEGLDLPGALCAALFITKLPFTPPDDPVGEARAEWLRSSGGNPFTELVVPATAIRLAQWVGRAIRTEHDQAQVYCYDKRLSTTAYGQLILKSLPAFQVKQRFAQ